MEIKNNSKVIEPKKYYLYAGKQLVRVKREVNCAYKKEINRMHYLKRLSYKYNQSYFEDLFPNEYPLTISAEDAAIHNMEMEAMRQALEELSESDKQLIEELFFYGTSLRAYSRKLNVPVMTLHYRKASVLSALRKKLNNI